MTKLAPSSGFAALLRKEIHRFTKVFAQTVVTPMITSVLYLVVFAHILEARLVPGLEVGYQTFIVPGLVMMTMLQNSFANSSSSMLQAKMNGSITFLLLAPLSALETWAAFALAALVRALLVGGGVWLVGLLYADVAAYSILWMAAFAVCAGLSLGGLGLLAGIWSEKFDHMSAFQNFVILPLSFLSGVFYSVSSLTPFWAQLSHANPLFYMIDGFRYGMIGVSDINPVTSLMVAASFALVVSIACVALLRSGYRLRT